LLCLEIAGTCSEQWEGSPEKEKSDGAQENLATDKEKVLWKKKKRRLIREPCPG
jgi:hypothetical protein